MKLSKNSFLGWVGVIALIIGIQFAVNRNLVTGEPPSFAGQTVTWASFDLAHTHGKPAVIYFWAEWCPICRSMQDSVQRIAKDHPFISLAMQSGTRSEVIKYMQEQDFQVPALLDEDGEIARRYGLRGVPAVFILGPDGKIRYATTGYTSEIGMRIRLWLAGL